MLQVSASFKKVVRPISAVRGVCKGETEVMERNGRGAVLIETLINSSSGIICRTRNSGIRTGKYSYWRKERSGFVPIPWRSTDHKLTLDVDVCP